MALALCLALEVTAFAEPVKARLDAHYKVASGLTMAGDACIRARAIHDVVMAGDAIRVAVKAVGKEQGQARVGCERNALQPKSQERHCEYESGCDAGRKRDETHRGCLVAAGRTKRPQRSRGAQDCPRHHSPWRKRNSRATRRMCKGQCQNQK
jgi:hypothetical protein